MERSSFWVYALCAILALGACPNAGAGNAQKRMTLDDGIKKMLLGKGKNELLRKYPRQAKLIGIPTEGETLSAIKFELYKATLTLYLKDSVVTEIEARDSVFQTSSGLQVGDTLGMVRSKHKNGQFYSGMGEGAYITYQLEGGTVSFAFDVRSIPYSRFLNDSVHVEDPDVLNCAVESIWIGRR